MNVLREKSMKKVFGDSLQREKMYKTLITHNVFDIVLCCKS